MFPSYHPCVAPMVAALELRLGRDRHCRQHRLFLRRLHHHHCLRLLFHHLQAEEQRARSEAETKPESEASPPLSSLFQPAPPHPAEPAAAALSNPEPEATCEATPS